MKEITVPFRSSYPTLLGVVIIFSVVLLCACAKKTPHEERIQEWLDKAETSRAYTPTAPPQQIIHEINEEPVIMLDDRPVHAARLLPTQSVSLNIHDSRMAAILLALARIGSVNMVMSPNVYELENTSVHLQEVPWDNAFKGLLRSNGLTFFWEGDVLYVYSLKDIEHDINLMEKLQKHQALSSDKGRLDPLVTSIVKLRYITPSNIKTEYQSKSPSDSSNSQSQSNSSSYKSQQYTEILDTVTALNERLLFLLAVDENGERRGSIHYEPDINSLVIHATKADTTKVLNLLEHIDRPRPQVHIQAHIVETTKDTARDLGIQWGGRRVGFSGGQPWVFSPGVGSRGGDPASAPPVFNYGQGDAGMAGNFPADFSETLTGLSLGLIVGGANYLEAQLSALQKDRKLNILSSPSITTLDNLTAITKNGETVPYVSYDSDGRPTVEFKDAVLELGITPNVIDASQLRLRILVKKDHVDDTRNVQGNPYIIKKETQTSLIAGNGETVVISGLTEDLESNRVDGVPWLMNLPGVGSLFKRDYKGQIMSEVLIFITPTILPERPAPVLSHPDETAP